MSALSFRPIQCMSIVIITIPDKHKQQFVSDIQNITNQNIGLVVIQKPRPASWLQRLTRLVQPNIKHTLQNLWYTALLYLRPKLRSYLTIFRSRSLPGTSTSWAAPTIETDDINSPEIQAAIAKAKPELLITWGCTIVKKPILNLAPKAINLHLGLAEQYRGAVANQYAVALGQLSAVGFTIHYVNHKADAGDIILSQAATINSDPLTTFQAMNDQAYQSFVEVVQKIHDKESLPRIKQDLQTGKNIRLQEWTPRRRYLLAKRMQNWLNTQNVPNSPIPNYE